MEQPNLVNALHKPYVKNDLGKRLGMQKEIYVKVDEIRRESYSLNSKQNLNLIKKKKGISELNITNFIRRFVGFDALIKIHEMSSLRD
jgi:hypothetical protein